MAAAAESKRVVHFVTPENIEVTYELAGIGSRFVAVAIDHLIQAALCIAILAVSSQISKLFSFGGIFGGTAPLWIQAVAAVVVFVIIFGYFVFFELRSAGQTPGKRAAKLRVVRDGGYPVDPYASVIRNLVRLVDLLLPPPYGAGLISIFTSKEYKRLGDFAAGTIVIKLRQAVEPPVLGPPGVIVAQLMPHVRDVEQLTPAEYAAIHRFVERRKDLSFPLQVDFAMRLALPLMTRLGITVAIADQSHYPDLIEAIDRRYTDEKGLLIYPPPM